jgi:hypothetical protein
VLAARFLRLVVSTSSIVDCTLQNRATSYSTSARTSAPSASSPRERGRASSRARRIFLEFHDFHRCESPEIARKLECAGYRVTTRPELLYGLTGIGYIDAVRRGDV